MRATTESAGAIWFLDHAPILGGAERFALKIASAAAGGRPPLAAVIVCPPGSELAARAIASGIEVRPFEFPSVAPPSPRIPGAALALRRLLASAAPDTVIVANTARAQALLSASRARHRSGLRLVDLAHEQETAARRSARFALRHSRALVAIGSNAQRAYQLAIPGARVGRINNALDDREFEAAASAPHRRSDHAPAAVPALAVLARMIPEKGLAEVVAEAAANAAYWSTLTVAAPTEDPAYEAFVRAEIQRLGLAKRIHLAGEVVDVHSVLNSADVLVIPSVGGEGQPTAALEALARGLAVLLREPIASADYAGLPVGTYCDAGDFGRALAALPREPAPLAELRKRFDTAQALDGLLAAGLA